MSVFKVLDDNACNLQHLGMEYTKSCDGQHSVEDIIDHGEVLATNCTLESLNVAECCYFEQPFGIALLNGLKRNKTLRYLDIHGIYFDSCASNLLKEVLLQNKSLCELNISHSRFTLSEYDFISSSSLRKMVVDKEIYSLMGLGDNAIQVEIVGP